MSKEIMLKGDGLTRRLNIANSRVEALDAGSACNCVSYSNAENMREYQNLKLTMSSILNNYKTLLRRDLAQIKKSGDALRQTDKKLSTSIMG